MKLKKRIKLNFNYNVDTWRHGFKTIIWEGKHTKTYFSLTFPSRNICLKVAYYKFHSIEKSLKSKGKETHINK